MRVLHINKFLYPRGGAEVSMFETARIQKAHGDTVALWGTIPPSWEAYDALGGYDLRAWCIESMDLRGPPRLDYGLRTIWSSGAQRALAHALGDFNPDIVHIHLINSHISPSILPVCVSRGIPVVMTVHDYQLICPNYKLYTEDAICERCFVHRYWNAVSHKCVQDSYARSALAAATMAIHKRMGVYEHCINHYITPSDFMRHTLIRWGFSADSISTVRNHIELPHSAPSREHHRFILYVGRLAIEKGIDHFMRVVEQCPEIPFVVAGTGPLEYRVRDFSHRCANLTYVGHVDRTRITELMGQACALVVPSVWYENYPSVVLEAMAHRVLVIASAVGGIPEMISSGETGVLCSPADDGEWCAAIRSVWGAPQKYTALADAAYEYQGVLNDPAAHYRGVRAIYERFIEEK